MFFFRFLRFSALLWVRIVYWGKHAYSCPFLLRIASDDALCPTHPMAISNLFKFKLGAVWQPGNLNSWFWYTFFFFFFPQILFFFYCGFCPCPCPCPSRFFCLSVHGACAGILIIAIVVFFLLFKQLLFFSFAAWPHHVPCALNLSFLSSSPFSFLPFSLTTTSRSSPSRTSSKTLAPKTLCLLSLHHRCRRRKTAQFNTNSATTTTTTTPGWVVPRISQIRLAIIAATTITSIPSKTQIRSKWTHLACWS